ncbi:hypothetical protein [Anaerotignum propionicum]|uniref:Uncharacterized protein n=1 Tax=Anaerotignum propionicum DSM 1682 TaxID=991789 RepID=A0A120MK17_ANAPI|nr:hypothetical protein [Anaerotignum propionicum]AMJ39863.1 hypothetical protein CPRO_02400 [Anaerotignum propionicum DSM 1682]SHE27753.1 hypothetical protein SAMN02745151_00114 [[Clostridium] propionicum DSM 1682] [Anaerotignum propionicum DSM 1682]
MFASNAGRKRFFYTMLFSWAALLYPWIFPKLFEDRFFGWIIFPPYLPVLMALLLFLCFNKLKGRGWKISFSVLTELLLISIPILCFWPMMVLIYMKLKYENVVSVGQGVTFLNWINFSLVCIPILVFPILRRWRGDELQ